MMTNFSRRTLHVGLKTPRRHHEIMQAVRTFTQNHGNENFATLKEVMVNTKNTWGSNS